MVPDDWVVAPLGNFLCLCTYGFTNPMPTTNSGPYKVVAKDIHHGIIDFKSARHTSEYAFRSQLTNKSRPRVNDILLTKDGSIGRVAICNHPTVCINQSVALLRSNGLIFPLFLKYLLLSPYYQQKLADDAEGTTIKHIYITRVDKMEVAIPPLPTQQAIARVLRLLDDKIELNRQMNETLEAMARAIFKSWFVDFDPVRAKAEGRQPAGMDAETAALFPDRFEEVDRREVPRGWGVVFLPEVFEINPKRSLMKDQIAPYLDMQNVPTQGHRPIDWIQRTFSSGTKFINGDTLLARITPCLENGKTIFVDFLNEGEVGWGSTEYIVLKPKPPLPPEFGYLLARHEDFRSHAILNMSGSSGRQRVPSECFDSYKIVKPSDEIAEKFGEVVNPLIAIIKRYDEQSRTLAQIRDNLLPKLINGEIKV